MKRPIAEAVIADACATKSTLTSRPAPAAATALSVRKSAPGAAVLKPEDFRLLSDPSETTDYQFGGKSGHHRFCKTCGMHAYGDGYVEQIGGAYVSVQISCLDDVSPEDLAGLPVRYFDGLTNNWMNPPKVTSYL